MPVQTFPFHSLIVINKSLPAPVYQQLANGLIKLIIEGQIQPGYNLPPSRVLAESMGLNRTTVVAAYEELKIQDWIEVLPRKGVFVSRQLPLIKPRTFKSGAKIASQEQAEPDFFRKLTTQPIPEPDKHSYSLVINDGYPDARIAPLSTLINKYKSLLNRDYQHKLLLDGAVAGAGNLRVELASFLTQTRGMNVNLDNVMVTRGAQIGIYMASQMVIKPGSRVIVGDLSYNLANEVFLQAGAILVKVKVNENGIDVDEIERLCAAGEADLLYIIPHHHHPTTVTLSAERRMKLLNVIQNFRLPVIEDDYDYDFHYDNCPILPLASADHKGYVIYIGSITKTLAPSIKMGYIVANKAFIWQVAKLKKIMEIRGDVLMEEAVASLYSSGEMQRHITRSVKLYKVRRDFLCDLLRDELGDMVEFQRPLGGMAIWITFNKKYSLAKLTRNLAIDGIYMNDGSRYNIDNLAPNAVRLGFASMNEKEMRTLVAALRNLK